MRLLFYSRVVSDSNKVCINSQLFTFLAVAVGKHSTLCSRPADRQKIDTTDPDCGTFWDWRTNFPSLTEPWAMTFLRKNRSSKSCTRRNLTVIIPLYVSSASQDSVTSLTVMGCKTVGYETIGGCCEFISHDRPLYLPQVALARPRHLAADSQKHDEDFCLLATTAKDQCSSSMSSSFCRAS